MLDHAIAHKDELSKLLAKFSVSDQAMYFSPYGYIDSVEITDTTWHKFQIVAIHAGKIQGFLSAIINRETQSISNLSVCKFCDGHELEFAADIARIFQFLRQHFRWIKWSAMAGSPTEAIYGRIANDFSGRQVGRFTQYHRLRDGRLVDAIWFEVPGTPTPDCVTALPAEFRQ